MKLNLDKKPEFQAPTPAAQAPKETTEKRVTVNIPASTHQLLRMRAAETGERIGDLLDRYIKQGLEK